MIINYFEEGYTIQRYNDSSGAWSDGEGIWGDITTTSGRLNTLGSNERSEIATLETTHRFYTEYSNILFGDQIIGPNGVVYKVKLVDHKSIPISDIDFYQVDCEAIR